MLSAVLLLTEAAKKPQEEGADKRQLHAGNRGEYALVEGGAGGSSI